MERIIQKIGRINEYLKIIESIKDDCKKRFNTDLIYRGAMLHYLYLVSDTSIVLAEMIIKLKGLRIPQSYSEAFDILGSNGILDSEFAYSFTKIAGFRNFLAHDYDRIDAGIICESILNSLLDIKKYIQQISKSCNIN
jgi:uncharacterized protein YutE (UPF0331/DUF86 family)